jgi:N-acetylglucosaminyldiphosphoundecaprenol N-acetyl-beta-D-mannosaminyltransferase
VTLVDQLVCQTPVPEGHSPVLGITFSSLTHDMLIRHMLCERIPAGEGVRLVVTANVDHIANLARSARFRAAYAGAWVATADGAPVYLYARLRGSDVPERVAGADLTASLLDKMVPGSGRPFFVVGSAEAGRRLRQLLIRRGFPRDAIAFSSPRFGFEDDPDASTVLAGAIRDHGTTHLFFGLGAPKSEIWIHEHRHLLGDTYALAVGASLDFHVGLRRRAPVWMRRAGLEWSWRVLTEPRRLFRRYFVESWFALLVMAKDLFGLEPEAGDEGSA